LEKNTKSQQSAHHNHKEKDVATLEEETIDETEDQETEIPEVLEEGMIGHGIVLGIEIETIDHAKDSETTSHTKASETGILDVTDSDQEENQTVLAENLEEIPTSEKSLESEDSDFIWLRLDGQKRLATENYVEGNTVYGEKLYKKAKIEYRIWDPFRSKLAAALYIGLDVFPITHGTKVLYLGASTGTTVSHISDIVGYNGLVFAVEHASRVARDFLDRVANFRKNVIPILQDARHPKQYFSVYGKVDVVYSDIAQPDQTEIAITNCQAYLKDGGYLFLVIKTRSIDVTQSPKNVIQSEMKKLQGNFEIIQDMTLEPYDKDHGLVIAKYHTKG
jgi:fibrillarin-like pre-rRNA processing protein